MPPEIIAGRLAGLFSQARNNETTVLAGSQDIKDIDAWARGFGKYMHQKARGASNGYYAMTYGTLLGADKAALDERMRLGFSAGFSKSDINSKDNSAKTDIDSYQATFYGSYTGTDKPYYLNGALSFAYNEYEGLRQVAVGSISRTAASDYDGAQYSVLFDGGYTFENEDFYITPIASLQYLYLRLDDYTEEGAGALNLEVDEQDYDMLESGLGIKLERPIEIEGGLFMPEIHARWLYDFIGDSQETTSSFSGGGGSFSTEGFEPAQNTFNAGTRLTLITDNRWILKINYDLEYKEDYIAHMGWADIRHKF